MYDAMILDYYHYEDMAREMINKYMIDHYENDEAAELVINSPEKLTKAISEALGGVLAEAINDYVDDLFVMTINGEPWK